MNSKYTIGRVHYYTIRLFIARLFSLHPCSQPPDRCLLASGVLLRISWLFVSFASKNKAFVNAALQFLASWTELKALPELKLW
jgi:hypothetical protein